MTGHAIRAAPGQENSADRYGAPRAPIGKDPTYVMRQLGHSDPAFTLRVET